MTQSTPQTFEKPLSSGKHDFGEEMELGDATGETPMDCFTQNRLSRGSTFLQHPLQPPHISHRSNSGRRSVANKIFFSSCLAFKWLFATHCKTLHHRGGKRFYNSLYKASPGSRGYFLQHAGFQGEHHLSLAESLRPAAFPSPPAHRASILPKPQLLSLSLHTKEQLVSQAAKAAATKAE